MLERLENYYSSKVEGQIKLHYKDIRRVCSRVTSPVELSSGPAAQSRHYLRTVQTTAEGTPLSEP